MNYSRLGQLALRDALKGAPVKATVKQAKAAQ